MYRYHHLYPVILRPNPLAADVITKINIATPLAPQIIKSELDVTSQQPARMASTNEQQQQQQQQQQADLVVLFDCDIHLSKQDRRDKAHAALQEYQSILDTLHNAGLAAAGKPGNTKAEIMVLISCPLRKLYELVEREKCV